MRLAQHVSKDKWAKYEPVLMPLADSTAVARQVNTLIRSNSSALKTAGLELTSGPQPPQGTGKHVAKPDLALQAGHVLVYVTLNLGLKACKPFILVCTKFTQGCRPSVNLIMEHCTTPKLEMNIFRQPMIHLRRAKEQT